MLKVIPSKLLTTSAIALGLAVAVGTVPMFAESSSASEATNLVVQKETGTVTGIVKDAQGQPAPKVPVRLVVFKDIDPGQSGGSSDGLSAQPSMAGAKTVAKAITDKDGKFTFKQKIPAGNYQVEAGNQKVAFASNPVIVKGGQKSEVVLQLRPVR